jgi:hypothetical protein
MSLSTAKWVVFLCSLLPSQSAFVLEGSRYSYAQFRNARDHREYQRAVYIWA